ncbi:MAG: transporter ATP-binding protein [Devosia sp.]|uniref:ABC transporter ATP-binding protein n=1 Tax=Devosia sp. TaxID=1871048 RepID=UPI002622B2D7|nr:ABC transporter ATP-binding protein [Devosia sp.]MDB5529162.1 transporter ATP-binding protein [Devosia sp.]
MSTERKHARTDRRPTLSVRGLSVAFSRHGGENRVVDDVSLDVWPGEIVGVIGESGSGKTLTALSALRMLPKRAQVVSGGIRLGDTEILALNEGEMRALRGDRIAFIPQDAMQALNPTMRIGRQVGEPLELHRGFSLGRAKDAAIRLLEAVHIRDAGPRSRAFPHQFSGGMQQRAMIAMGLALDPELIIADEPTTALDVTVQAQILSLIRKLQAETGTAVILITHDMGVVAEMADRVLVMKDGRAVEAGPVRNIFAMPKAPYTQALLAAVPRLGEMTGTTMPKRSVRTSEQTAPKEVVEVDNLTVRFDIRSGFFGRVERRVHAVEGIGFKMFAGETLALVGESGCGKSTTGKALLNLVPFTGDVRIAGTHTQGLRTDQMKPVRRDIQMIFQDPFASLDPRMRVGDLVAEPLRIHGLATGSELTDRVAYLFKRVGLSADLLERYPHEFSGGQRQRICIARALSLSPKIIVADESVSALDVSIQAQVLDLLQDIQNETGIAYLFISHDMGVVEQISHRVAVMYLGRFVEVGTRAQVFDNPQHPYTKALIAAVPVPDPTREKKPFSLLTGDIPSSVRPFSYEPPSAIYRDVGDGHLVAELS